ncbi:hypothetical protein ZHAS_00008876 [Anopheles sinensis]|uniref:Uncharacterized protein n=1 Tax=Anopheles sinensis TaxID=74873 RepID=A0A084VTI9_ANOSI|nr:hypothetical protein ZHAS_00008876 [Anopheles sinensis]
MEYGRSVAPSELGGSSVVFLDLPSRARQLHGLHSTGTESATLSTGSEAVKLFGREKSQDM